MGHMKSKEKERKDLVGYYEDRNILNEVTDDSVDLVLDEALRKEIIAGKRRRNLKNITIKIDPLQITAIKKLSTMKSIPYQTLIRHWLAESLKHEMDSVLK
jgi:predicted DNA binding CopG/RHH family protein